MGRTLFWYILKDLIRIFLLTSGALAGIMSFGGLLRPLTEHGLDLGQVGKMLSYFMPAMTTYSLPIAALFAATMVYGRLAADNEVTACRATGISMGILGLGLPALVFGMLVALLSLLLLCFVVPAFMLKAEKVVFTNVAQIVANAIEQNHQIKLSDAGREPVTIFAQGAQVLPPDPKYPNEQAVVLRSPTVVTYEPQSAADRAAGLPRVPRDFMMVDEATAYISQSDETDEMTFTALLRKGVKFGRRLEGSMSAGIDQTIFTARHQSLVKENTRFMNVLRLKQLLARPQDSNRVRTVLADFVAGEQTQEFLRTLRETLAAETDEAWLATDSDAWIITRGAARMEARGNSLLIGGAPGRPIKVREQRSGEEFRTLQANQLRVFVAPDNNRKMMNVTLEFTDALSSMAGTDTPRERFQLSFSMQMPDEIARIPATRQPRDYATTQPTASALQRELRRSLVVIGNTVTGELHARASFAVSCLVLVLVGCALGMMFKSGNFLTAFAVSVAPALACIALIITGQHTCENVPRDITHAFKNNLDLGLGLIWGGNVAVAAIAGVLLARLQRQ